MTPQSTATERRQIIKSKAAATEQTMFVPSAGSYAARPVVRLPLALPS